MIHKRKEMVRKNAKLDFIEIKNVCSVKDIVSIMKTFTPTNQIIKTDQRKHKKFESNYRK